MTDHFEAMFDSNYLRWFHLPEGGVKIKIKGVKKEEMQLPGSRDKSTKPVLHYELVAGKLEEGVKPLVLNKTNARLIAECCGRSITGWIDKEVVLFQSKARLGRETVECIRVRSPKS